MRLLRWLPLLFGLSACGPASVSGVVDGDRIGGARDAIFDTLEFDFGPVSVNLMAIVVTDFGDSCQVLEEFFEDIAADCDTRCDNARETAEDYLGAKDYWALSMGVVAGGNYEDTYDYNDNQPGEDEFNLVFNKYDVEPLYDANDCEAACEDTELLVPDVENGNGGTLEITEYETDEFVKGTFEVDMGGDEDLRGSFNATHCNMADWIPWF